MNNIKAGTPDTMEMLAYGGVQFATGFFMAFSAYYLMMFFTDMALIPPAAVAAILLSYRLIGAIDSPAIALFINRSRFRGGKYLPYIKWCALPFAIGVGALGFTPVTGAGARIIYAAFTLILCELGRTVLETATFSLLPYLARDDKTRSKFVSFSNSSAILAFIIVGTFMLPLAGLFGGADRNTGFALALVLFAVISIPLNFNASFRLKERYYGDTQHKPTLKDMFLAIGRSKRLLLFLIGFCLYSMADAFKSMTTYYYITFNIARPDLLPLVILTGLVSPLAMQPIIPRLLTYAKKETLIIIGLVFACGASLLMIAAGTQLPALAACIALYGVSTAIVANLAFTMIASFTDEARAMREINMSEILTATLGLSSSFGIAIASGITPIAMKTFGYVAQAVYQTPDALTGIKMMFIICTAAGMALAGIVLLASRKLEL